MMNMRRQRRKITSNSTRKDRLARETQMYDVFERLQAVTDDPRVRERAVNLLIVAH